MEVKNYFATDTQGNVLGSAQVYLYLAGTTTLATGLQNITGAALGNPFTSDPNGLVQFRAADGDYDLRVVKPGREFTIRIQCFDGVNFKADLNSAAPGKGADLVSFEGLGETTEAMVGDLILGIRSGIKKKMPIKTIVDYAIGLITKDAVNLSDYADGTGGDDTAGIQAAVNAAISQSLPLYVGPAPSGAWNMRNNSPTNFSFSGSLTIFGCGMDKSIIKYNDDLSSSRRDFFKGTAGTFIAFDIAFVSSWGDDGDYSQRSQLVSITGTDSAYVQRVKFSKSRYMSLILSGFQQGHVSDCEFDHGVADGCRLTNVPTVTVVTNKFWCINDDMIAIHTSDSLPAPVDRRAVISGNIGWDSQGIAVLGSKMLKLTDNIIIRPHTRGLLLGCSDVSTGASVEGNTPPICLDVSGNLIIDPFTGTTFSANSGAGIGAVVLRNTAPKQGSAPGFVGGPNGSGGVVQPYDYVYLNNIDEIGAVNPGAWWNRFSNNSVIRTLKPVAKYSDYGFGLRYGRSGPVDPQITASSFLGKHYVIQGQASGMLLDGNVSHGATIPISFDGVSGGGYVAWPSPTVRGGKLSNYTGGGGIFAGGDGVVIIDGVEFDGDPFNTHPFRTANGKWNASYTTYSAVWLSAMRAVVKNCKFRNIGSVFQGATLDRAYWEGNVIFCNPVATGYSSNNIGVGDISVPARLGAVCVIEDGDPSSATFNTILNICLKASTAMPTSGKYVAGHIVMAATTDDTLCWKRKTTGSSHVAGTDWAVK